jgi:predicted ArsR family transcriptional regulator
VPLVPDAAPPGRPALADRLLAHLSTLSSDGVVERPLVDVAKQLDVGAPSVSRALGRLVDDGLARIDRVGTRGRPTRIALVAPLDGNGGEEQRLREENRRLVAEVAQLRKLLDTVSLNRAVERRTPKGAS